MEPDDLLGLEDELGAVEVKKPPKKKKPKKGPDEGPFCIVIPPTPDNPFGDVVSLADATPQQALDWAKWSIPPGLLEESILERLETEEVRFMLFKHVLQMHVNGFLCLGQGELGSKLPPKEEWLN